MQFTILHQTAYVYHEHVHESFSVVHLQPCTDMTQYCTRYELHVTPTARVFSYRDRFGNDVQHFAVLPDHDRLSIVARSEVVTVRPADPPVPAPTTRAALQADPAFRWMFDELAEGGYIVFSPELTGLANEIGHPGENDDLVAWVLAAGATIKRTFTYDTRATTVRSGIDEAIRLRAGVCQDFAHILIALSRLIGIPARYVSGYLFHGEHGAVLGAEASHAWVELYLPPHGWLGFDPTNDVLIDDRFAKIGVGRDYHDLSPVRGVYKGASKSTLAVNVEMEALAQAQAPAQTQ